MKNNRFTLFIFKRYAGKLSVVFLLNCISIIISILIFLLIEPFCKILFRGNLDDLSPISKAFIGWISNFIDLQSLTSSVVVLIVAALLLFLLKNVFSYASQWVMASMRSNLLYYMRNRMYDKIIRLPLSYYNIRKRGDVVSRAVNDTQEVQNAILASLKTFLTEPVSLIVFLVALFCISVKLSLYALVLLLYS